MSLHLSSRVQILLGSSERESVRASASRIPTFMGCRLLKRWGSPERCIQEHSLPQRRWGSVTSSLLGKVANRPQQTRRSTRSQVAYKTSSIPRLRSHEDRWNLADGRERPCHVSTSHQGDDAEH